MFTNKTKIFGRIFFYAFIFLLPWQTRFIFTPEKPELLSFSIYLSEIFFWIALAFWLTSVDLKKIKIPGIFLIFSFFAFLSIAWSADRVAAFRLWLFIFDGIMVYLFLREHADIRRGVTKIFLFSLFIASLFGIWQFFNLGSPAFKWLGLAVRGAWNLGDIVVQTDGARWLRAYGPFPHPNIFGGYLVAGLIVLFNLTNVTQISRSYKTCYIYFLSAVLFFALFLTFSRSAWLALAVALMYVFLKKIVPSLSITVVTDNDGVNIVYKKKILSFLAFLFFLAIALSIIFWPLLSTRALSFGRLEQKSNTERVTSWKEGLSLWLAHPILGSGIGNLDSKLLITNYKLLIKNTEPAHNIFILVLSQLGLIGFAIYFFLWRGFWKNPAVFTPTSKSLVWGRPLLILFFIIGLFDHYLWTLYSGQMLFWLGLGLSQSE